MGRALLRFLHLSCDDWYLCPSLYYLRLNQIFIFYFFWILKRFNCNSTLDLHVTQRIGQNLNSRTHKSELCFKAIFWLAVHFPWHFSSVLLWQTSPPKFRVCCPNWCWLLFFFSRFLVMLLMLSYFSKTRLTWHVPIRSDKNTRLVPVWVFYRVGVCSSFGICPKMSDSKFNFGYFFGPSVIIEAGTKFRVDWWNSKLEPEASRRCKCHSASNTHNANLLRTKVLSGMLWLSFWLSGGIVTFSLTAPVMMIIEIFFCCSRNDTRSCGWHSAPGGARKMQKLWQNAGFASCTLGLTS